MAAKCMGEALLTVGRAVGDMPFLAERSCHVIGVGAVVFNDQESHENPLLFFREAVPLPISRGRDA